MADEQGAIPEGMSDGTSFGEVQCHCSEDDGVPDVGVSLGLGCGKAIWIGELLTKDGATCGMVFHDGTKRIVAPFADGTDWQEAADILRHHVGPALATPSADRLADTGEAMREAIDAGLRAFCGDTEDFDMSAGMRRAAIDFIMGQPGIFATPKPPVDAGDIQDMLLLVEFDMNHRRRGGDDFVGVRKEVAAIITALRKTLATPADAGDMRERCARLADDLWGEGPSGSYDNGATSDGWNMACSEITKRIRNLPDAGDGM